MPKATFLNKEEKAQIQAYKNQGLSGRYIGIQIGRSHSVVNKYLRNTGQYGQNRKLRVNMSKAGESNVHSILEQARQLNKTTQPDVKLEEPLQITEDDDIMTDNEWEIDGNHIETERDASVAEMEITTSENVIKVEKNIKPTNEEAFNAFDTVTKWAEEQCDVSVEQLLVLRKLQCLAARQALISKK